MGSNNMIICLVIVAVIIVIFWVKCSPKSEVQDEPSQCINTTVCPAGDTCNFKTNACNKIPI